MTAPTATTILGTKRDAPALSLLPLPELVLLPLLLLSVLRRTKTSPVESEAKNMRSWESQAMPTGRKQFPGQLSRSGVVRTSTAASLLSLAEVGWPLEKLTEAIL